MEILEECLKYLDSYEDKPKLNETLIETASLSLQLILSALEQQVINVWSVCFEVLNN